MVWIDSHCHLDVPQFDCDRDLVRQTARLAGVAHCVLPAMQAKNWATVQQLARQYGDSYALGIHPLYVESAQDDDLTALQQALQQPDRQLVAIGEVGLDGPQHGRQRFFWRAQLQLARQFNLPLILHGRLALEQLLQDLRRTPTVGGIIHAFHGSWQQAQAFIALGFKIGIGGAVSFERAKRLRALAQQLPLTALVLETDAPYALPCWRYVTVAQRAHNQSPGRNTPADLVLIARVVAQLRGMPLAELAQASSANVRSALPRLRLQQGAAD